MTWRRVIAAIVLCAGGFAVGLGAGAFLISSSRAMPSSSKAATYYRNCAAAVAAGVAPIAVGKNGYRAALDSDADGLACEPFQGR